MGKLVDGIWHDVWYDTEKTKGKFVRSKSQFRNWITPDGAPGPDGCDCGDGSGTTGDPPSEASPTHGSLADRLLDAAHREHKICLGVYT